MEYKKEGGVDLQIDKLLVVNINLLFFSPIIFIIIPYFAITQFNKKQSELPERKKSKQKNKINQQAKRQTA